MLIGSIGHSKSATSEDIILLSSSSFIDLKKNHAKDN